MLVSRLITKSHPKTNIFFVTRECALKIALTRSIFQPKMHQIPFGGGAPPGPTGELTALPRPPSCIKGCLLLRDGRDGGEDRGKKGVGREGGNMRRWF